MRFTGFIKEKTSKEVRAALGGDLKAFYKLAGVGWVQYPAGTSAGLKEFYLTDHLGSTREVYDLTTGEISFAPHYFPYGKMFGDFKSSNDEVTEKFTGKELDEGIDLMYFGARYFDQDLGVWTAPDPGRQYHNLFNYGNGNPINSLDPNGKFDVRVFAIPVATGKPDNGRPFGPYEIGEIDYQVNFLDVDQLDLVINLLPFAKVKELGKVPQIVKSLNKVINLGTVDATTHKFSLTEHFFDNKVKKFQFKLNNKEVNLFRHEGFSLEEAKILLNQLRSDKEMGGNVKAPEEVFKGIDENKGN